MYGRGWSFAPLGLMRDPRVTHGLRRGLHSCAAPRPDCSRADDGWSNPENPSSPRSLATSPWGYILALLRGLGIGSPANNRPPN